MSILKAACKAFWVILLNKPHVYCDNADHSMVGDLESLCLQVDILSQQIDDAIRQCDLLDKAKDLVK